MKNGPMLRVLAIVLLVHFGESFRNAVSLFFIRDIVGVVVPLVPPISSISSLAWGNSFLVVAGPQNR